MKDDKINNILKFTAYISGFFTLFIAVILIMGYIQLELVKPLENPSLVVLKEQFDADPNNEDLKEQIRSLDLMARRAFFATRWQLETGTILLLLGAGIYILSQRLLIRYRRRNIKAHEGEINIAGLSKKGRLYLFTGTTIIVITAFIVSGLLRQNMPAPERVETELITEGISSTIRITPQSTENIPVSPGEQINATDPVNPDVDPGSLEDKAEGASADNPDDKVMVESTGSEESSSSFPFFRGHGSRGYAPEGTYPVSWDGRSGDKITWKVKVPYQGYSSPVIWDSKIFLTGAEGEALYVMCFDKISGELLWSKDANGIEGEPASPPKTSDDTGLAAPTSALNSKYVCSMFGNGNLICFDHDGNRIWAKNLGIPDNHYGHSSSLIIHKNILVVQYDHFTSKSVMGFDVNTGKKIWETFRQVAISWASPVIAEFNGVEQVILSSEPFVISYDIMTGAEIWSAQCMSGEVGPSVGVNSSRVFAVNDFAVLSSIDPNNQGEILWQDNEYTPEVASPVATEELIYILTTWGGVAAYDAETGDIAWSHDFDYGFYSSPMIAGDKVYMLDQAGVMHIVDTGREFKLLGESPLGERANCTPAFSENRIYLRSDEHLYCIGN